MSLAEPTIGKHFVGGSVNGLAVDESLKRVLSAALASSGVACSLYGDRAAAGGVGGDYQDEERGRRQQQTAALLNMRCRCFNLTRGGCQQLRGMRGILTTIKKKNHRITPVEYSWQYQLLSMKKFDTYRTRTCAPEGSRFLVYRHNQLGQGVLICFRTYCYRQI
ncbi:hypothetical protein PROFUN_04381 [Planoprotostelium fungivorum]|uniref:Uncharacterized protein n=1 Tax=Planoprotostelium fungivorum TaxID=1890364 RepID=A0A2P6NHU1_9EUKA|nr:hypothetical protein PROFUN_04381 [Planoprotostelium fungivorum]